MNVAVSIPAAVDASHELVNAPPLSHETILEFREKGYIKLPKFLTPDCATELKREALKHVVAAAAVDSDYGKTFKRLTYDLGQTDIVLRIVTANAYRRTVVDLIGNPMIVTEAQAFELGRQREGFTWHYDSLSFRYIRPQDPGYSMWIPLDPVRAAAEGGGMAYVPESIFSARTNFQLANLLSRKIVDGESLGDTPESLLKIYGKPGLLWDLFEQYKEEDDFEPGDAFLFRKSVWHRSSPFKEGGPESRLAVTIRHLDWRARLDPIMFQGETQTGGGVGMGTDWGTPKQTNYGAQFTDIQAGEEIRASRFCGKII